jgi:hypothetical protein
MSDGTSPLRKRIEDFEIDDPGSSLPFTSRLAREQGWTHAHAGRVVREYKRFLCLAMEAGHPVTPPEPVDQAWHLHLVYTRSYWHRLCREILGQELHHEPTAGGNTENHKFRDWYQRTLESYQRLFAESPPPDIWPDPLARFRHAGCARWIDLTRYWLVPRPGWLVRG